MFRKHRFMMAIATTALILGAVAGTARAAGSPGPYVAGGCGWILQPSIVIDSKLSVAVWPKVAAFDARRGVADSQYVYAAFQWYEHSTGGSFVAAGNTEWRWTYASDSSYTIAWKTFGTNLGDQAVTRFGGSDANGAGYGSADQYLYVRLYWYTGSAVTGTSAYWAQNPSNANNAYVCNGGGWLGTFTV